MPDRAEQANKRSCNGDGEMIIEPNQIYSPKQVGELIGTKARFIVRQVNEGKLAAIRLGGDRRPLIRIKGRDVLEWLDDHYTKSGDTDSERTPESTKPDLRKVAERAVSRLASPQASPSQ